jgi:hypothetical protein
MLSETGNVDGIVVIMVSSIATIIPVISAVITVIHNGFYCIYIYIDIAAQNQHSHATGFQGFPPLERYFAGSPPPPAYSYFLHVLLCHGPR